jgi:hypothetical protein
MSNLFSSLDLLNDTRTICRLQNCQTKRKRHFGGFTKRLIVTHLDRKHINEAQIFFHLLDLTTVKSYILLHHGRNMDQWKCVQTFVQNLLEMSAKKPWPQATQEDQTYVPMKWLLGSKKLSALAISMIALTVSCVFRVKQITTKIMSSKRIDPCFCINHTKLNAKSHFVTTWQGKTIPIYVTVVYLVLQVRLFFQESTTISGNSDFCNSVVLVCKRTIPTERPQPVGEVSANFSW